MTPQDPPWGRHYVANALLDPRVGPGCDPVAPGFDARPGKWAGLCPEGCGRACRRAARRKSCRRASSEGRGSSVAGRRRRSCRRRRPAEGWPVHRQRPLRSAGRKDGAGDPLFAGLGFDARARIGGRHLCERALHPAGANLRPLPRHLPWQSSRTDNRLAAATATAAAASGTTSTSTTARDPDLSRWIGHRGNR